MKRNKPTVKDIIHPELKVKSKRTFVSVKLEIESWKSVQPYFEELHSRKIQTIAELERWLRDRSELLSVLEEDLAWRYIRMNCDTSDKNLAEGYIEFVSKIEPEISRYSNLLNHKFQNTPIKEKLDSRKYKVFVRALAKRIEIFREESIPLISELQVEEQEYGKISSEMSIPHKGKEITLQEAANFIKDPDRDTREEYYRKINERRHKTLILTIVFHFLYFIKRRNKLNTVPIAILTEIMDITYIKIRYLERNVSNKLLSAKLRVIRGII